jgi:hypothetical protein
MNKTRFEAFSDGVFAFAITLLVLGFTLPELRPKLIAYGLSFGVIGSMWQNHHALVRLVDQIDRMTVFLNLCFWPARLHSIRDERPRHPHAAIDEASTASSVARLNFRIVRRLRV